MYAKFHVEAQAAVVLSLKVFSPMSLASSFGSVFPKDFADRPEVLLQLANQTLAGHFWCVKLHLPCDLSLAQQMCQFGHRCFHFAAIEQYSFSHGCEADSKIFEKRTACLLMLKG